jgi:hypothetical protein
MSAGGAAGDRAIYEVGPAYAHTDDVVEDQIAAHNAVAHGKDLEKKESGGDPAVDVSERTIADLRRTEENYDPNFPDDVYPTDEEKATLRRVADAVPIKAYAIAFVELCERFSYYGATQVFTNFSEARLLPNVTPVS